VWFDFYDVERKLPVNAAIIRRAYSSQLFQNIVSNYAAVVWMGLLTLGLIPVYLRLLGPEQWGIVAICMAIQGFMGLLDAGLGQVMPREVALARGDAVRQAHVFRLFARSYLGMACLGFVAGQLLVPFLIAHWFNSGRGLDGGAEWVLRLLITQFFFQFANNAHAGYWNGLQAQRKANFRQCLFGTAKHMAALASVSLWLPEAQAYVLPFVLISALEWWANRQTVIKDVGSSPSTPIRWHDFQDLGRNAGVLAVGVLAGMVVSQLDRIVLSRTLDASSYGAYVIVANLGMAFLQLQYPLMRAFFPRVVLANAEGAATKSMLLAGAVLALCVLPCLAVAWAAPWILQTWLSNPDIASAGAAPLRLILGAVAVNALYHLIYQRMVAKGENRAVMRINATVLVLTAPLLIYIAPLYGALAGGIAWLLASMLQLALGGYWLIQQTNSMTEKVHTND
jgi:O-antigen/teichoic acid export membrane protein